MRKTEEHVWCDVCKEEVLKGDTYVVRLGPDKDSSYTINKADVCSGCYAKIKNFIEDLDPAPRSVPYGDY